jgi:hypothetical protein
LKLGSGREVYHHLIVIKPGFKGFQRLPLAGPADTEPGVNPEHGTMGGALDVLSVVIQKLVRLPFKREPKMWTAVHVGVKLILFSDKQNIVLSKPEPPALIVGDVFNIAQYTKGV